MTARAKIRPMVGVPLETHIREALEAAGEDASLTEQAVSAWSAQHQMLANAAANQLERAFDRMFGKPLEVNAERFDRKNPRECAGGTCDDLLFGFRNDNLSIIVPCAKKDCPQELHGAVNGLVELGRVLSLIEDEKEDGETTWKCQPHRTGTVV